MKEFMEAILSGMAGKISDDAMMHLAATLSVGRDAHMVAIRTIVKKARDAGYKDGYDTGYKFGHTEGWTEGEESGFYEAQQQMQTSWRDQ